MYKYIYRDLYLYMIIIIRAFFQLQLVALLGAKEQHLR